MRAGDGLRIGDATGSRTSSTCSTLATSAFLRARTLCLIGSEGVALTDATGLSLGLAKAGVLRAAELAGRPAVVGRGDGGSAAVCDLAALVPAGRFSPLESETRVPRPKCPSRTPRPHATTSACEAGRRTRLDDLMSCSLTLQSLSDHDCPRPTTWRGLALHF